MLNKFRAVIMAGAVMLCVASVAVARADVLRTVIIVAENQSDYNNNVTLLPTFETLMKKGAKAVYVGSDAAALTITTSSVWATPSDIAGVTGTDDWKAAAAKVKAKPNTPEVFQLTP